jgi:hypothetical protein
MYDTPLTIDQILTQLAEQPMAITALTAGLPRARLQGGPHPFKEDVIASNPIRATD